MRHEALAGMCVPQLVPGEIVRECIDAVVLDVNGAGAAAAAGRILLAFTGTRLLTLVWRDGPDPVPDGAVPAELVAHAVVEAGPVGVTLEVALLTGATVRFGVGPAQVEEARSLAAALAGVGGPARVAHSTEELPALAAPVDLADRVELAAALAALCDRTFARRLELVPGAVVEASAGAESTYFVHVAPQVHVEGGCPRCRHHNRAGAVFCDACGALL